MSSAARLGTGRHTHIHTPPPVGPQSNPLLGFSFQTRINECTRQMASLLNQIRGPLNANTKNQVEADSDNMLRPLMDFLDGK